MPKELIDILAWFGAAFVAMVCAVLLSNVIGSLKTLISALAAKRNIRKRHKMPPTAKCYCDEGEYLEKPFRSDKPWYCYKHQRYTDDWHFCSEAEKRTLSTYKEHIDDYKETK